MLPPLLIEERVFDVEIVNSLARELNISPITARILASRRLNTATAVSAFLNAGTEKFHDPFLLKDLDVACERVITAIKAQEKICVYGDYDVDGAVGTALLVTGLRELGAEVDFYVPNRMTEGYSLNIPAVHKLKTQGFGLLITVDNGITAHLAATEAKKIGLDLIITDHHKTTETLPEAIAVVNPQRQDCSYPFKGISGAGVGFKLLMGLRKLLREQGWFETRPQPFLKGYLDLLCLPTVCDVVPLIDENRAFVREGLARLPGSERPGLQALLDVCGIKGDAVTATDVGFKIGPRINACGRLEDASLGVRLLLTKDFAEAKMLATRLDAINQERRDLEVGISEKALTDAQKMVDRDGSVGLAIFDESWHIGISGIVASRVTEKLGRPTFILAPASEGMIKGSGRSAAGIDLVAALRDCSDCLEIFGGHEAAAGLTLRPERLLEFQRAFDLAVRKQLGEKNLTRKFLSDGQIRFSEITRELLLELGRLEPHGPGNAKPLFYSPSVAVKSKKIVGEDHLKLQLNDGSAGLDAIAFRKAEQASEIGDIIGVLFGIELNRFRDREIPQLIVKEIVPAA